MMHYGNPENGIPLCDEGDDELVTERVDAVNCRECLLKLVTLGRQASKQLGLS